jgi:Family of unknown function (DUF6082)
MIISLIATLISSIALVGVAVSLLLQSSQLRASQLQAVREMQTEFLKLGIDNPALATATLHQNLSPEELSKAALQNFHMIFLQTAYLLKTISRDSVSLEVGLIFEGEYPRAWWSRNRGLFQLAAATRREREFFALVDAAFERAISSTDVSGTSDTQSVEPSTSATQLVEPGNRGED